MDEVDKETLFKQLRHEISTRYKCPENISKLDIQIILSILHKIPKDNEHIKSV